MDELKREVKGLKLDLAEQIDRGLRNCLTVHNVPLTKQRESWDETKAVLAKFLSTEVSKEVSEVEWAKRIQRAHRGRTTVIHANFKFWEDAEEVRDKFREQNGKIDGKFVNDKHSDHTSERRQKAYEARKKYRANNPNSKLYIKYPAILMCKDVDDAKYNPLKYF